MSDRLKFRVWDNVEKKYLDCDDDYVDYAITRDGILILIANDNSDCHHVYLDKNRYIIEQCTGVKDKKGNLIYEGDIVSKAGLIREVIRNNEYFTFKDKNGEICIFEEYVSEVIGNIHENPELLDADKA